MEEAPDNELSVVVAIEVTGRGANRDAFSAFCCSVVGGDNGLYGGFGGGIAFALPIVLVDDTVAVGARRIVFALLEFDSDENAPFADCVKRPLASKGGACACVV